MNKNKILDKISRPLILILIYSFYEYFRLNGDWADLFISIITVFSVLIFFSFIITDRYIKELVEHNESIEILFDKNFGKSNSNNVIKISKNTELLHFETKSGISPFHTIRIKIIGENGENFEKTLKTNSDKRFIRIINKLTD